LLHDYNNCQNSILICTENRSELTDGCIREGPQEKRNGDIKMFQNENKINSFRVISVGWTVETGSEYARVKRRFIEVTLIAY